MKIRELIFIGVALSMAAAQYSGCIYNGNYLMMAERYQFNNGGTAFPINASGYTHQVNWQLVQPAIKKWSYVLSGISFNFPSGAALKFDVSLSNMTTTNGIITFYPSGNTQINSILLSIILINGCETQIELQTIRNSLLI